MELLILDPNFEPLDILDSFESLIWTDRYCGYGDFEIYTAVTSDLLTNLQKGNFLYSKESMHMMVIEGRQITSDVEEGNRLIVTGRSLESILDRRIVWGQSILTGNFQVGIQKLLNENVINPSIVERKINNFIFEASTNPIILALTIDAQLNGENLYSAIKMLCESQKIGFRITLDAFGVFTFKLYSGADRSYEQVINPYVIFAPKFDNLLNSNYVESTIAFKNIALVGGEGEGAARKTVVTGGVVSGLSRREIFADASTISSTADGRTLTEAEYNLQLTQKGLEVLSENVFIESFEGQVDTTQLFKYGEDFFMGDIVQLKNEYGVEARSRVTELIRSQSLSGVDVYPTFSAI